MTEQQYRARVRYVIGPDGSALTVAVLQNEEAPFCPATYDDLPCF